MKKLIMICVALCIAAGAVFSQNDEVEEFSRETLEKREYIEYRPGTMELYNKALKSYYKGYLDDAEEYAKETLNYEANAIEAKWLLASIYHRQGYLGKMLEVLTNIGIRTADESAIANHITSQGSKGYVLSTADDLVYIDYGRNDSVSEGETFVVFGEGDVLQHPFTFEIVNVAKPYIAKVNVVEIYEKYSICEYVNENEKIASSKTRVLHVVPEEEYKEFVQTSAQSAGTTESDASSQNSESSRDEDAEGANTSAAGESSDTEASVEAVVLELEESPEGDGISSPEGFHIADDGAIYLADTGNNRIIRYNRDGSVASVTGANGRGEGEFDNPVSIESLGDAIVVSDKVNHRLQMFSSGFEHLAIVGSRGTGAPEKFQQPKKLLTYEDELYVLDTVNKRVQVFDSSYGFVDEFRSNEIENFPSTFTIIPGEALVVVDYMSGKMHYFDLESGDLVSTEEVPSGIGGKSITDITYMQRDDAGYLVFVLDKDNVLALFDADDMSPVKEYGEKGSGPGEFNEPMTATYYDNALYVLERGNRRIQKIRNLP